MTTTRTRNGEVLQGYFRIEAFRGGTGRGPTAQLRAASAPGSAPRPELLPAAMRGLAAQPRIAAAPAIVTVGAPRRGLPAGFPARPPRPPGMGPAFATGQLRATTASGDTGITTTPLPAERIRTIGGGQPLEPAIRRTMEQFFQADFATVRVHEGPAAGSLGALAFTVGDQLHFAPGLYDPGSADGVALLGHELTHVVQQREGRVANPYGQGLAIVQDPALEAEADRRGREVAQRWSSSRPGPAIARARGTHPLQRATAPVVQRQKAGESGRLIVEDDGKPGPTQVRRSEFFDALRVRVREIGVVALEELDQPIEACPYIPYWFSYYAAKDAKQVEAALEKYAPGAKNARDWRELLDLVAKRVDEAFVQHIKNGSYAGVPDELPKDLDSKSSVVSRKAVAVQPCFESAIDRALRLERARVQRWRQVVPRNPADEILFRKLSNVRHGFNINRDAGNWPINYLNFTNNEAADGLSFSRNHLFVAPLLQQGYKVIYVAVMPQGHGWDLEAAYLAEYHRVHGAHAQPPEYNPVDHNRLSQEVTAESMPANCVIGWAATNATGTAVVWNPNPNFDAITYPNIALLANYGEYTAFRLLAP